MATGDFTEITIGAGLVGADLGGGAIEISATATGGDPATDTKVWMPLFDSDGAVVFDDTDVLIPTLIPIA